MPTLIHLVSLQQAAGVEAHFTELVTRARERHPDWQHGWLNPSRTLHPFFRDRLGATLAHRIDAKYWHGLKVPAPLRARRCRRALERARTDVLMIWNRSAKVRYALDAVGEERCIHWEHGAAWDPGHEAERHAYFARVPRAIANSRASARVLELHWGYRGRVRTCRNALRPSLKPSAPVQKAFPRRAIVLGVAARLYPVKGVALAVHALKALVSRACDAELRIAGAGPERERLEALARSLGLAERVRFLGAVAEMEPFYRSIDCLVHPPLTEAFGLVAIEAAAFGCPVITAAIDGLPEAVADGVSGRCVAPTLPLAEYYALGGAPAGMPAFVYDPARDALAEPRAVDPDALARAVEALFASADVFERASASASAHVLAAPSFDEHVDAVLEVVEDVVR